MINNDKEITELQTHLETLRKLFGWSAEQLGERLGITKQSVLNLEKGPENGGVKMSTIQYIAIRAVFETEANTRPEEERNNLLSILSLVVNDNQDISPEKRQEALTTASVISSAMLKESSKTAAIATLSTALVALSVFPVSIPTVGGMVVAGTLSAWMTNMLSKAKKDDNTRGKK